MSSLLLIDCKKVSFNKTVSECVTTTSTSTVYSPAYVVCNTSTIPLNDIITNKKKTIIDSKIKWSTTKLSKYSYYNILC